MSERADVRPPPTTVQGEPLPASWPLIVAPVVIAVLVGAPLCLMYFPLGLVLGGALTYGGGWYGLAAMTVYAVRRRLPRTDPRAALRPGLLRDFGTIRQRLHLTLVVLLALQLVPTALSLRLEGLPEPTDPDALRFAWMVPTAILGPLLIATDWWWAFSRHVAAHEREAVGRAAILVRVNLVLSWIVWPAYTGVALGLTLGVLRF